MKCQQFQDLMDEYLDNELHSTARNDFEFHCNQCQDCRSSLKQRRELLNLLEESAGTEWSIDITENVMKQICQQPLPVQVSPYRKPLFIATACGVIAAFFIFYLGIAGFPTGVSILEVTGALGSLIEPSDSIKATLSEIKIFGEGCWIAGKALVFFAFQLFKFLVKLTPFLILPAVILALSLFGYFWYYRQRVVNGYVGSNNQKNTRR